MIISSKKKELIRIIIIIRLVLRLITDDSNAVCRFSMKFGADMNTARKLLEKAQEIDMEIIGVSFHCGSGQMTSKAFVDAIQNARTIMNFGNKLGFNMNLLDIGGGFPGNTGTEDYFDSAFFFNGGQFHLEVSGFTHYKEISSNQLEWSAYRMHDIDPIFFTDGFRYDWRNGDVVDDRGFKCIIDQGGRMVGNPTQSIVTAYTWVYVW